MSLRARLLLTGWLLGAAGATAWAQHRPYSPRWQQIGAISGGSDAGVAADGGDAAVDAEVDSGPPDTGADAGVWPDAAPPDTGNLFSLSVASASAQYLQRSDEAAASAFTSATISAWIRPVTLASGAQIVGKWGGSTTKEWLLAIDTTTSQVRFSLDSTSNTARTTACGLATSTWTHICIDYNPGGASDATRVKIYCNGVDQSASTTYAGALNTSLRDTAAATDVGCLAGGTTCFNGLVDEVVVSSGRATSCTTIYNGGVVADESGIANLVYYLRMENNPNDSSGSARNFTANNAPTYSTTVP